MSARPKRPTAAQLAGEVAAFNRHVQVGDLIYYCEVQGGPSRPFKTRTPASILSGHTAVVWLEGKSGCVCCSHCHLPAGVAA